MKENVTKVVILGAGGLAREVLWILREMNLNGNRIMPIGFISEVKADLEKKEVCGLPVLGDFSWFDQNELNDVKVVCGVGSPLIKQRFVEQLRNKDIGYINAIHPSVRMSEYVTIGNGVVMGANVVLTTQIDIGNHVLLNLNATIGHDVTIGEYSSVSPGGNISGFVKIGAGTQIGSNVVIVENKVVGSSSFIGAGSVVNKDIPDCVTAVGIPARIIKKNVEK